MLILRIKRAETALADGRLDEACGLAQARDVRAHHKGQQLIGRLARALIERGREHLLNGRLEQAAADGEKAGALAGNLPELAELQAALKVAVEAKRRQDRYRGDALAEARQHLENGRLTIGEAYLERAEGESARVALLRDRAADRRAQAEAALNRARLALEREDWPAAAQALLEARTAHSNDLNGSELRDRLTREICDRAAAAIDAGRLDRAEALLDPALRVAGECIEVRNLDRFLAGCREALAGLAAGQPRIAGETLRRLATIRPGAGWIAQAAQQAQQAAEHLESLRSGPLGLLMRSGIEDGTRLGVQGDHTANQKAGRMPAPPGGQLPAPPGGQLPAPLAGQLPSKLLFHVDGVGSYLVLRDRLVNIGPAGSSRRPEVGLLAEPGLPCITVERVDEDYFVSCDAGVRVNDATVKRKLLVSDDRIALSPRARARFVLPNPASTSAALQLAGTRLPGCEARQVILMDREIILGPGPSAHIRADHLRQPAIFQVRDGRLFCRTKDDVLINDEPMDRHAGLPLGAQVRIGDISLVVTAV